MELVCMKDIPRFKCNKKPSVVLNITKGVPLNKENLSIFNRCILDEEPIRDESPFVLVVDSLCPLGIEVVDELKKRGIKHLDIRGKAHLNLASEEGKKVLSEFWISKSLIVCNTNQSRQYKPREDVVISFVRSIPGTIKIEFPPVFGHFRGKRTNSRRLSLFTDCQEGNPINVSDSNKSFVLAEDAAKIVVDILEEEKKKDFKLKKYTMKELSSCFKAHCNDHRRDRLVERLMSKSKPYPPQGNKELTLSIVGTSSLGTRFTERLNKTLALYDLYLRDYFKLPLEIIVVIVYNENNPDLDLFSGKPYLSKYLKIIKISNDKYMEIYRKHNLSSFNEFIFKNIGIRRARGEYIMANSLDAVPPKIFLDYVLHHQFTPHTYMKNIRREADMKVPLDTLNVFFPNTFIQRFLKSIKIWDWPSEYHNPGGGDLQLAHWTSWENIKGYLEGNAVYSVDTMVVKEFFLQQPNNLYTKFFENSIHWWHFKSSPGTPHAKKWNSSYQKLLKSGFVPADLGDRSDDWGELDDPDLPPVVF